MSDPHKLKRGQRLDAWVEAHGGAVACLVGAGYEPGTKEYKSRESYLSVCRRTGMGHGAAVRFEQEFERIGMQPGALTNNLDDEIEGSPGKPIAQILSPEEPQTPLIKWEELMASQLPEQFRVELVDGALAPYLQAGDEVVFARSSAGKPGDIVLVKDRDGNYYARVLREGLAGRQIAHSPNAAYAPLDMQALDLQVVGVCVEQRVKRSTISF